MVKGLSTESPTLPSIYSSYQLANLTTNFNPSVAHRSKDRALAVCIALRLVSGIYRPMNPDTSTPNVQLWPQEYIHRKSRMKIHDILGFPCIKQLLNQTLSREANDCRMKQGPPNGTTVCEEWRFVNFDQYFHRKEAVGMRFSLTWSGVQLVPEDI